MPDSGNRQIQPSRLRREQCDFAAAGGKINDGLVAFGGERVAGVVQCAEGAERNLSTGHESGCPARAAMFVHRFPESAAADRWPWVRLPRKDSSEKPLRELMAEAPPHIHPAEHTRGSLEVVVDESWNNGANGQWPPFAADTRFSTVPLADHLPCRVSRTNLSRQRTTTTPVVASTSCGTTVTRAWKPGTSAWPKYA